MSETITKACETCWVCDACNGTMKASCGCCDCEFCDGTGTSLAPGEAMRPEPDCRACHGTSRVPDVEATLRAQVARLTEERDYLAAERERLMPMAVQNKIAAPPPVLVLPPGVDGDIVALRVENARLAAQLADRDALIAETDSYRGAEESVRHELESARRTLATEEAARVELVRQREELSAEVARLKDVKGAAHGLIRALRKDDPTEWESAVAAVVLTLNATGTDALAASVREKNTPERIAGLLVENNRLTHALTQVGTPLHRHRLAQLWALSDCATAMMRASEAADLAYEKRPGPEHRVEAAWHRAARALQALVEAEQYVRQVDRLLGRVGRVESTEGGT